MLISSETGYIPFTYSAPLWRTPWSENNYSVLSVPKKTIPACVCGVIVNRAACCRRHTTTVMDVIYRTVSPTVFGVIYRTDSPRVLGVIYSIDTFQRRYYVLFTPRVSVYGSAHWMTPRVSGRIANIIDYCKH